MLPLTNVVLPVPHDVHALLLGAALYVPTGHSVHCAVAASRVYPLLHTQASADAAPPEVVDLGGHVVHGSVPVELLYVPPGQS